MKTLNRILTPLITLCIYPAFIFLPMFRIMITSGFPQSGEKTNLLSMLGLGEFISFKDIYRLVQSGAENPALDTVKSLWQTLSGETKNTLLSALPDMTWGKFSAAFSVITLLIGLALIICSAALKKSTASVILSAGGIASALMMNVCFNAFAKPFLNGSFSLADILGSSGGILSALLGNIANVTYMKLSIAYNVIIICFAAALIISCAALSAQKSSK